MNAHPIHARTFDSLAEEAVDKLARAGEEVKRWISSVRDDAPGRIRWAIKTSRDANVAATAYTLSGLRKIGILDEIITDEDRAEGIRWIRSMATTDGEYRDPALVDRKSPDWPAEKPWPDSGMLECNNRYAQTVLREYGSPDDEQSPPPPGWPQRTDDPADMVAWIRDRSWNESAWSAGSWAAKLMRYMLDWHLEGSLSIEPFIESVKYVYSIQDDKTGLWGGTKVPIQNRINGTFKLFTFIRNQLGLPLNHPEKMIDQVMTRFYDPSYDRNVGGCDEYDNWYVILHALPESDAYRFDEIRKMAAYRIGVLLDTFAKDDGGISFTPEFCQTAWVGFDMAPRLSQGDAMGLGLITSGVCACVELCGLTGKTSWEGMPTDTDAYSAEIKRTIAGQAGLIA